MVPASSALLAAAGQSAHASAAHDRATWVGLFTGDGRVEDPVGSRPHIGLAQIGRFYDTFIGPRDIVVYPDDDIVSASTVIRDLELQVAMGPAVTMRIPAYLRYDLRDVGGDWKIARLAAYWELPTMITQFRGNGARAVPSALRLTRALLRNQGLAGAVGFASGFRGTGKPGKRVMTGFLDALSAGNQVGARACLASAATITLGENTPAKFGDFSAALRGARWEKMISAGSSIAVSVRAESRGVLFAEMGGAPRAIKRLRYFTQ